MYFSATLISFSYSSSSDISESKGKVTAICGFAVYVANELDERLDYYTPVIVANTKTLEEDPEMVRAFLRATQKGYEDCIADPDSAAEILHQYAPDYDAEMLRISQEILADKYIADASAWGVMKDEVWDNYTEFMVEYGILEEAIPADTCYTNAFLPDAE